MKYVVLILAVIGSGFVFTGTALTGVLLLGWTGLAMRQTLRGGRLERYPLAGWLLAYLAWLVISSWQSDVAQVSWVAVWVLAGLPLAYFAWGMTPNPDRVWNAVRTALLLTGPVFALWGLGQVLTHYGYGYPVGPLVDKNAFAALMNVFWFLTSIHFIRWAGGGRRQHWRLVLPALGLLLIAMTLFAAESRGATLTWLLLMPIAGWVGYRGKRSKGAIIVVLAAALMGYFGAATLLGLNVGHRTLNLEQDASTSARILMWRSSMQIARDHPIAGTGWGTFAAEYPAYRDPRENTTAGAYAHNDYLQLTAEGGIPMLVLLLGILGGLLLQLKRCLASRHDPGALEASGLLLAVLAIFIQAGVNFIFCFAFMNVFAGLFTARAIQLLNPAGIGYLTLGVKRVGRATRTMMFGSALLLLAGPLCLQLLAQATLTGSQPGLAMLRRVWPTANAYEVAKLITALQPHSGIGQEVMLRASEEALKNSAGISMEGVNFQLELLEEALERYELIRAQTANNPAYGVREVRTLIQYREVVGTDYAIRRAREILMQNLSADPFHADSMIALSRLDVLEGHQHRAQQLLAVSMQHVLSRRDQQLLVVEILRQRAAPRKIAELDAIEKQLKGVRSDSETGKALVLPANFSANVDARLERIAKML